MKILPVLKALQPVMEVAAQLVTATRAARAEARPMAEEVANLERLAAEQAGLVSELAEKLGELAGEVQRQGEMIEILNCRSAWLIGVALAGASLAISAALVAWMFAG
jgi:hypothetical protein